MITLPEWTGGSLRAAVASATEIIERDMISDALVHTRWNVTNAAKVLGISRKGIQLKMHRLGLYKGLPQRARPTEDPVKAAARNTLNNAVASGAISRPDTCELCGKKSTEVSIIAHHPDYARPLVVDWICGSCHTRLHNAERLGNSLRTA